MRTVRDMRRSAAAALLTAMVTGCTWIELTDAGAEVAQGNAEDVRDCRQVGNVAASTQDRVVVERGRGKVAEELIVLARNEAATLGGDTVVPRGPMQDGEQVFDVYRCGASD